MGHYFLSNPRTFRFCMRLALIGKNEIEIRKFFIEMENFCRKFGLRINQKKDKMYDSAKEKQFKEN